YTAFNAEMEKLNTKIAQIESDRSDYIASSGRYWQEDEGVARWLELVDKELTRLKKLQAILNAHHEHFGNNELARAAIAKQRNLELLKQAAIAIEYLAAPPREREKLPTPKTDVLAQVRAAIAKATGEA